MAIVVLVLWLFTAGIGVYLLATSNLGRSRPAATTSVAQRAPVAEPAAASAAEPAAASAAEPAAASAAEPAAASAAEPVKAPVAAPVATTATSTTSGKPESAPAPPASKREMRRAARDRFDPPSLTAAKNAPVVPDLHSLLEFAHPVSGLVGFGFWLGYTLVHPRALGWIAFGLMTFTACLGLSWFAVNFRAAKPRPAPTSPGRPSAPAWSSCTAGLPR